MTDNNAQPVVSVIIPVYNVEDYLATCVESVLHQTLTDIEVILVDDGSPDRCPEMCDDFARKDSRVKVIHKKNAGLGYARNSGLEIARGRWICFVDSDDYIALNTLEVSVAIGEKSGADQVRYQPTTFPYNKRPEVKTVDSTDDAVVLNTFPEKVFPMLKYITAVPSIMDVDIAAVASAWGAIYRREPLIKSNVRFPSERELISEDNIFNLEYAAVCGPIAYTRNHFYFYRQNPVSLTSFRRDRIERSATFCKHLQVRMQALGYPEPKLFAESVMLGYLRTHLWHIFFSDFPEAEKRQLHREAVNHPYLKEIEADGEYRRLPLIQRIAFDSRHSYLLSKIIVKGREMFRSRQR